MHSFTRISFLALALNLALLQVTASVGAAPAAQRGPAPVGAAPAADRIPDRYIVVLREGVSSGQQVANEHAQQHSAAVEHVYEHALKGYAAMIPSARLAAVRADPRVLFLSEDRTVEMFTQSLPTGVDRIEGDQSSTKSGTGTEPTVNVGVAVIDTGSGPHSDLHIAGGRNCASNSRLGFGGKIDPGAYQDGNGHGTHVAGTIAAKDDASGVVGVAPGARLYSVRVLNNQGSGSWSWIICGIDWVTANAAPLGIKVANMSLGGGGSDSPSDANCNNANNDALHKSICNSVKAGVTYVVAAGNSNADLKDFVPAAYNEVLTVTAEADFNGQPGGGAAATCRSDVDETAADFSNWTTIGSSDEGHTIAAPGVCINSTWKGGGYNTISGTSMASPHVAGTVALCIAKGTTLVGGCADLSSNQIIAKLRADAALQPATYGFTGDPNSPSGTRYYGHLAYAGGY
jgi:subtilisin